MAKGQAPRKKRRKNAKKKFFEVTLPLTSTKVNLYAYDEEDLEGNVVKLDLTKNLRGKNVEMRCKINYKNNKLSGELLSLRIIPSYIKRVMRRGTNYVEDSFKTNSKDNKIIIKPFMVTRNKVSRAVRREIRKIARKYLESHSTIRTTNELFSEIMTNKLQKELSQKAKKIYPLGLCEIRHIEVLGPAEKSPKAKTSETKQVKGKTEEAEVKRE